MAGIGYVAIFFLAIYANFFVLEGVTGSGDAAEAAEAIADQPTLFRSGAVAFLVVFVVDVVVAWALYVLFAPVDRGISLLSAWFRLVYTVFLGAGLTFWLLADQIAEGAESSFDDGQRAELVGLMLDAFDITWLVGLVAFGGHLILMAWLLWRSRWAPRVLGAVLAVAGAAYIVDTVARATLTTYDDYATAFLIMVAVPSVLGELSLTVWLLVRGGRPVTGRR